jgi:tetratricopeptide (TPR) repeat protein
LLTLANLTARAINLVRLGSEQVRHPREALALGRIYSRAGFETRARLAYQHAVELSRSAASSEIHVEALRFLARAMRRSRRYDEAVSCWRQILESPGCARHVASEANEALAIHHEHRVRDLDSAQTFALRSLRNEAHPAWNDAVQHRLARIQRKMERKTERLKSEAGWFDFSETSDLSAEP